jgi:ADP-ribose pyrophosphatase
MRAHGPWTINKSDKVYVDSFIEVELDQVVRPDGRDGQHVVVHLKAGVCVLAIDDQNDVFLTKEFHYGIGRDSIEAVSGGIEPTEDPLATAQRELQEELGLHAVSWKYLSTVDPFTTVVVSPTRLYVATGLNEVPRSPEGTELIERVKMPLSEAYQKVVRGEITHAPTAILILRAYLDRR